MEEDIKIEDFLVETEAEDVPMEVYGILETLIDFVKELK